MKKRNLAGLFFFSIFTMSVAFSHSDATGIVKERMDAMSDMGDQSKLVADMFKGKSEFDRNTIVEAADAFALHGAGMIELFPDTDESRTGSNTEALPRIWLEWGEFNSKATKFVELSESLKEAVLMTEDEGLLKKAFFRTTKACSDCHKRFRKPKE